MEFLHAVEDASPLRRRRHRPPLSVLVNQTKADPQVLQFVPKQPTIDRTPRKIKRLSPKAPSCASPSENVSPKVRRCRYTFSDGKELPKEQVGHDSPAKAGRNAVGQSPLSVLHLYSPSPTMRKSVHEGGKLSIDETMKESILVSDETRQLFDWFLQNLIELCPTRQTTSSERGDLKELHDHHRRKWKSRRAKLADEMAG